MEAQTSSSTPLGRGGFHSVDATGPALIAPDDAAAAAAAEDVAAVVELPPQPPSRRALEIASELMMATAPVRECMNVLP
jgi:hypothetical protein